MKRSMLVVAAVFAVGCSTDLNANPWSVKESDEEEQDSYYDDEPHWDDNCLNGGCDWDDECQNGGCDWEYDTHPPSEPIGEAEFVACTPTPACSVECVIDVQSGESTCDLERAQGGVIIDMSQHERLSVVAVLDDPTGFSFHIGDSPSNNGHGGDGAQYSRDAELHLVDGDLYVYGSDHSLQEPDRVRHLPGLVADRDGVLEVTLGDGFMSVHTEDAGFDQMCFEQQSHDLLRLDADDTEGAPDRLWYMGLNQVYSGGRTGSGLELVELCFH